MKGQMGISRREIESLRKNQKVMLEIKNAVRELKNAFDGLISRLDWLKRECELEDITIETCEY